jgi:hypothetical protein
VSWNRPGHRSSRSSLSLQMPRRRATYNKPVVNAFIYWNPPPFIGNCLSSPGEARRGGLRACLSPDASNRLTAQSGEGDVNCICKAGRKIGKLGVKLCRAGWQGVTGEGLLHNYPSSHLQQRLRRPAGGTGKRNSEYLTLLSSPPRLPFFPLPLPHFLLSPLLPVSCSLLIDPRSPCIYAP